MSFDSRLLSGIGVVAAVVEAGSFARAGEAMGLTQPAVSRAVARLEERVGIRIFNRTARAISLTDEGRLFYESVAPLLAGIEEAAVSAGKSKAIVRGRLRVNVDGTFGHYVLAPRLGEFLDHYAELAIEISVRDAMGDLVAEGIDVAVRFGAPEPSSLKARLLLETRVLTCASPAYVARHGAPAHPEQLAHDHQCLLIRDPTTGRPFEWEFQRGREVVPLAASGRLMVNDTGSLLGACLGGAGVAQLLEIYARDLIAQNRLVQLLPDWGDETFPLYAFHHSSNLVSAKVRAFLEFVRGLAS
ncbi:LysR family transcriptional regulator [Rhizobium leguminosarum]|uniref:LysR family transcriptional regulator n=1 Tax=Rhizobium leguminosarum TaxID=384 RepID=UPI00035FDFEC|nr:LysR family transcriptional regulator [Rhizobium leguminosarum]